MIDVVSQISAVSRQVGSRTLEAGEARVVTVSQTYRAAVDDVWEACTSAERIHRWFLPVTGDLSLHGRYELQGNASGTISSCDRPHSFTATWEFGGQVSWIEVRFSTLARDSTRLEIEHIAHVEDNLWTEFGPGAVGLGWDSILLGLSGHLSPGSPAIKPEEAMAWLMSDSGREFMDLASRRWCEAQIASGADPEAARAAAERVFAAYTGVPEGAPEL